MTLDFCEVAAQGAGGLGSTLVEGLNIPLGGTVNQVGPADKSISLFDTDEFRMFCFKILPCPKAYRHDWTTCHFAHVAERARRRDPRKSKYTDVVCPDMKKNKVCARGDDCPCAHNLFEFWLHPNRYRTQLCKDGKLCNRKLCFFAHTAAELRQPGGGDVCLAQLALHAKLAYSPEPTLQFSDESPNLSGSFAVDDGFSSAESNICKGAGSLLRGASDTTSLHGATSPSSWKGPSSSSSGKSREHEDVEDTTTTRVAADLLAKVVCSMGANKLGTERDVAAELHKVLQTERGVSLLQGLVSELETRQSASAAPSSATPSSSPAPAKESNVAYTPMVYAARDRASVIPPSHMRNASGTPDTLSPQNSGPTITSNRVLRHAQSSNEQNVMQGTSNPLLIPLAASPSVASPRSPASAELPLYGPGLGVPCSQPSLTSPLLSSWNNTGAWHLNNQAVHDPAHGSTAAYLLASAAASADKLPGHRGLNGIPAELLDMYGLSTNLVSMGVQPAHGMASLQPRSGEHLMRTEMVGGRSAGDMEALLQYFAMQRF